MDEGEMFVSEVTEGSEESLRDEVFRAITRAIAAWQEVGALEGRNAGMTETRRTIASAEGRSAEMWSLLKSLPWERLT